MIKLTTPLLLTTAAAFVLSGAVANAATYYWNTTGTNAWADGAFWSDDPDSAGTTGTIAGSADIAVFNQSTINGATIVNIAAPTSVGGLVFNNTGTTAIRTPGVNRTLTIGGDGITINAGAGAVTFGITAKNNRMTIALSDSQTWTNNSSNALALTGRNAVQLGGNTLTFDGTGDFSQSGTKNSAISGTGSIIKNGSGTLTLTQTNTFNGTTTVGAGIVDMTINGALRDSTLDTAGSILGDATNGLKTNQTAFTFGGLTGDKDLASIFTTTAGGYDGLTNLNIRRAAAKDLTYSGAIADGAAGMSLTFNNGTGAQTLSGDNSYTGNTAVSTGTLTLSGNNTTTGTTTISGSGTLNINSSTALGTGDISLNGGTIDNTSGSAVALTNNQAILMGNANWTFGGSNDLNLGTGAVSLNLPGIGGTNVITLGGTSSTLTLGGHVNATNRNGDTTVQVDGAGNKLVFGSLSLNDSPNNRLINFTGSGDITVNGAVSNGSGSGGERFNYGGTGTFTMGGAGTYSGETTVTSGTLQLDDSLAMQNSVLNTTGSTAGDATNGLKTTVTTLTFGGITGNKDLASVFTTTSGGYDAVTALTLNNAGNSSYSGAIADGASGMDLNKTGAGTQTLTGTSTYTGETNVIAGTLIVDGSIASSSQVTVDSGATLGGSGIIAATVINGELAIGNSPGTMTFSSLTLAGSTITEIDGTAGAGVVGGHDFADVTNLLTYGGDMTLDIGTIFAAGDYEFNLFDFGSESGDFDSIVLADQYAGVLVFDGIGGDVWSYDDGTNSWTFTQSTGVLDLTVVPEPSSYALLAGLLGLSYVMVRRRQS